MTLERRYRRLLGVYPPAHRRAYEDEMIGVLMDSARPDQRRPGLAEAADLLRAGLAARLSHGAQLPLGAGWRKAAGVISLLGVLILAAESLRNLIGTLMFLARTGRVVEVPLFDVTLRTVVWLAVTIAVLTGARRAAVALAVAGLAAEAGLIVVQVVGNGFWGTWTPWVLVLVLLTIPLLVLARRARPATAVLGRTGTTLVAAGVVVAFTAQSLHRWLADVYVLYLLNLLDTITAAGIVLILIGLWRTRGETRRRVIVLFSPIFALPVAEVFLEKVVVYADSPGYLAMNTMAPQLMVLLGLPLLAFLIAVALLRWRERFAPISLTEAHHDRPA
ncbi:MAG: hypothetical protein ABW000_08975 [Actinoplanes sp.]